MKIDWESENMAWSFYFCLDWDTLFFAVRLAGIEFEFHIMNLRDIVYYKEESE